MCGVPNLNLYPSRQPSTQDDGRPTGYGQKQKNGNFGMGKSFAIGLGTIPGHFSNLFSFKISDNIIFHKKLIFVMKF